MNTELNTHNNIRLIEVDVAKAFAIIYMVVDHVYERMSFCQRSCPIYDHYYFSIFSLLFIIVFIIVLSSYLSAVAPRFFEAR